MICTLTRGERVTRIFEEACRRWSVDAAELRGPSRLGNLIPPRAAVVLALRQLTPEPLSYPAIGEKLGGRDHASALHLAHRGRFLALRSTGFRAAVDDLIAIARDKVLAATDLPIADLPMADLPGVGIVPEMNSAALQSVRCQL